jgi:hypothetical protein
MTLDLTDQEAAALTRHLRQAIDYDPYPFAPRLDPLKASSPSSTRRHGGRYLSRR